VAIEKARSSQNIRVDSNISAKIMGTILKELLKKVYIDCIMNLKSYTKRNEFEKSR
jgi:hypothetical protein